MSLLKWDGHHGRVLTGLMPLPRPANQF